MKKKNCKKCFVCKKNYPKDCMADYHLRKGQLSSICPLCAENLVKQGKAARKKNV